MLKASRRVLVLTVVAAALMVGDAAARTIRRSCRDGTNAHRAERSGRLLVACDVGARCDGACTFEVPVCGADSCQAETFTVPSGSTRRERIAMSSDTAPATLVLRCGRTGRLSACGGVTTTTVTTTTTTGSPGAGRRPTTTTQVRLVGPSTTSSTTTASTSSTTITTTTTIVIPSEIPCLGDADCDGLATACAVSFCADDAFCAQVCVCVTPDLRSTCALDATRPCLTAGECVGADDPDPTCHVCYLNLCRTVLVPACFPGVPVDAPFFGIDFSAGFGIGGVSGSTR